MDGVNDWRNGQVPLIAIRIFEASGNLNDATRSMDVHRLFRRGETWSICRETLAVKGPMTTKELVDELMKARKLEVGERVLAPPPLPKGGQFARQAGTTRQVGPGTCLCQLSLKSTDGFRFIARPAKRFIVCARINVASSKSVYCGN